MSKSTGPFPFNFKCYGSYSKTNWLHQKGLDKFKGLIVTETYKSDGVATDVVIHVQGTAPTEEMITSMGKILGKQG